ncbi:MAG TPA: DUF429 domain-containing protein [Candidatus Binataceae bacterium]|nr:DUF429 domain-containing protein [Candidatus Binataceae bacterium]
MRVPVVGIEAEHDPLTALAERLKAALSPFDAPIIAFIDSPRWPSDCDCRWSSLHLRDGHTGGRRIDNALRAIVRSLAAVSARDSTLRLSLFPTPRHDYFIHCIVDRLCKPHLRVLGRQLFGISSDCAVSDGPRGGAIFTRFMLTGFAAYRSLETLGVKTFEAYPDLQFRLWCDDHPLAPKSHGRVGLAHRSEILTDLAAAINLAISESVGQRIMTMDEADAAILVLSAAAALDRGAIALIDEPEEGCFAIPLQWRQAAGLGLADIIRHPNSLTPSQPLGSLMSAPYGRS